MHEYRRVGPGFWNGRTGKALKAQGPEAVIVAMYLMTCQHSNMLGLYYVHEAYIAVDTGLGIEGASKGLAGAIEAGFCMYDRASEVVWVIEMAAYQIADRLDPKDLRCKGIQRDYEALPENPFLGRFYERYGVAFNMSNRREESKPLPSPFQAPPKPGTGTGTGTGAGTEELSDEAKASSSSAVPTDSGKRSTPKCPYDRIVDAYHEALPDLPKVVLRDGPTWTDRQKAMRSVWAWVLSSRRPDGSKRADTAEDALTWFKGYFERAADNDFISGRSQPGAGHENWRASLDYLLSKKGLKQVIELTKDAA